MCKKQSVVSHSSAEAYVISLDAGLRLEGMPALMFWDQVIEVLGSSSQSTKGKDKSTSAQPVAYADKAPIQAFFDQIDYTPSSLPITYGPARMYVFEDNEAVIRMIIKRSKPELASCIQDA